MAGITQEQIDQAKALGYSDAQIDEYLNPSVQEPAPAPTTQPQVPGQTMFRSPVVGGVSTQPATNPWIDRSQEQSALVQGGALLGGAGAAKLGAEYLAAKKLLPIAGQAIGEAIRGPQPNIGTPQQVMDVLKQPPTQPTAPAVAPEAVAPKQPPVGGPAAAEGATFIQRMSQLASKYAPAARIATGAGLMAYSPSLNAGEDEQLRKMRELQDQQRAQGLIR